MGKLPILLKNARVNKFDSFIYDFLVTQKEVALAKIGILTATAETVTLTHGAEQVTVPKVNFTYDRKVDTTPELIAFIAEKLGKSKLLITADLDSYFEQVRQFINLGKPYLIQQIGTISLNKFGEYEFSQQHNEAYTTEEKAQRQYYQTDVAHTEEYRVRSKNRIAGLAIVIIILIIAGLGWGAYTLFFNKQKPASTDTTVGTQSYTTGEKPVTADSSGRMPDSIAQKQNAAPVPAPAAPTAAGGDSLQWKFVFETTTNPERAHTRTAQLLSFGDPARYDSITTDSGQVVYRLFLRGKAPVSDTGKMRDSLELYFQRKVRVVPAH